MNHVKYNPVLSVIQKPETNKTRQYFPELTVASNYTFWAFTII